MRGADHDRVPRDDRCGVQTDLAGDRIHLLVVFRLEVDDAAFAEGRNGAADLRVERDQLIAGGDVENPLFLPVRPVRDTAAGELPRSRLAAPAFIEAVLPEKLAGTRVERDHRSARAARRVQHALYHQRRGLEIEFGTW